jgi:hypothetical protein
VIEKVIYCQWLHRSKIVYRQYILTNAIVQLPVPLVSSFLIDLSVVSNVYLMCVLLYLVYKHKNRTAVTNWAGTTDHSRAPEIFPVFSRVCVTQSLVFSEELLVVSWSFSFGHCNACPSIYCHWLPIDIFKLFFHRQFNNEESKLSE